MLNAPFWWRTVMRAAWRALRAAGFRDAPNPGYEILRGF
jgi:hypothetical protein